MRGSKTPANVVLKFKRKLLELGTPAAAARACKIPISTAYYLAKEVEADPEFVRLRNEINTHGLDGVLDRIEAVMMAGVESANAMIQSGPKTVKAVAAMMQEYGLKSFTDPRPAYLAQVVNAHRSVQARQRAALDSTQGQNPARVILEFTDGTSDSTDGAAEVSTESATEQGGKEPN